MDNLPALVFILLNFHQAVVQAQQNAQCHFPRLTPRHALNLNKLMGQWYLHEFVSSDRGFDKVEPKFKCTQTNYVAQQGDVARTGQFTSVELHQNLTTGIIERFEIPITVPKLASPVSAIWDAKTLNGPTNMVVLNADREHSKWFILYSCSITGVQKYRWETVGIWSRSTTLDPTVREILKDYLIGLGFPLESHKFHSQQDCLPAGPERVHVHFNTNKAEFDNNSSFQFG